ncbi:NYN domain-containing protein [bacterium]|nr:NYN domain-containing protein [bacterium]
MNRINYLIDGFNVYHSMRQLWRDTRINAKWLNLNQLCSSYLHMFGKEAHLEKIYYFTALAYFITAKKPDAVNRHKKYIKCLESTRVLVELGRFKKKEVYCHSCRTTILKHEEKETDVAIAVKLLEILFKDECDTVVLMTGDTDLSPAVKRSMKLFPEKKILFAFPYKRKNKELLKLAPDSFTIHKNQYIRNQFPAKVVLTDGKEIEKPNSW